MPNYTVVGWDQRRNVIVEHVTADTAIEASSQVWRQHKADFSVAAIFVGHHGDLTPTFDLDDDQPPQEDV